MFIFYHFSYHSIVKYRLIKHQNQIGTFNPQKIEFPDSAQSEVNVQNFAPLHNTSSQMLSAVSDISVYCPVKYLDCRVQK